MVVHVKTVVYAQMTESVIAEIIVFGPVIIVKKKFM
jgi:hypothetical protein